jgi:hypothetical protein
MQQVQADCLDNYDLVNIHKLKHASITPTQISGSNQIDFIFISASAAEFVFRCGILDYITIFLSDYHQLYIDTDISIMGILGYPIHGTLKALEQNLKLHDPCLIDAYQSCLIHQLDIYFFIDQSSWTKHKKTRFNCIDPDVKCAMLCAANCCRRKSFKSISGPQYTDKSYYKFGVGGSNPTLTQSHHRMKKYKQ